MRLKRHRVWVDSEGWGLYIGYLRSNTNSTCIVQGSPNEGDFMPTDINRGGQSSDRDVGEVAKASAGTPGVTGETCRISNVGWVDTMTR